MCLAGRNAHPRTCQPFNQSAYPDDLTREAIFCPLQAFCKVKMVVKKMTFFYNVVNQIYSDKENAVMLFAPKEKAQGLVEYALILVLVAVVVIVILALLGPAIGKIFSNVVQGI